jgi:hypothetical protein
MDEKRTMLRPTLATVAYRGAKAVRDPWDREVARFFDTLERKLLQGRNQRRAGECPATGGPPGVRLTKS